MSATPGKRAPKVSIVFEPTGTIYEIIRTGLAPSSTARGMVLAFKIRKIESGAVSWLPVAHFMGSPEWDLQRAQKGAIGD